MKHVILSIITAATLHIDMYQDRFDTEKTVILIEKDGRVHTFSVANKDLDAKLVEKLVENVNQE